MDSKEDSLKHATKLLQGKNLRVNGSEDTDNSSRRSDGRGDQNQPRTDGTVQGLRDDDQEESSRATGVRGLHEGTDISQGTIREDRNQEDDNRTLVQTRQSRVQSSEHRGLGEIKPHLKTIKYDNVMTALHSIEWKQDPKSMWPTPTTKGFGHASEGQTMIMRRKVEAGELTEEEAQAMMNGTTLRPPRLKKWMWPTPKASGQEKLDTLIKRKGVRAAVQHNLTAAVRDVANTNGERSQRTKQSETIEEKPRHNSQLPNRLRQKGITGSLNPTWVEWLMGYPAEYTDLKHWEILSSRKSSKK